MRSLELRRHARRDKAGDRLSTEGRVQAEDVGRTLHDHYDLVFVSPAQRAADTAAWFLRGRGLQLPPHSVITGLASELEGRWRAAGKAATSSRLSALRAHDPGLVEDEVHRLSGVLRDLIEQVPVGGRALAVGHSPLIEAGVLGLTGVEIEPLAECEGVLVTERSGVVDLEELRLADSG